MDGTDESTPVVANDEVGLNDLLGLFSGPAFVRRGSDLEHALRRLHARLDRERSEMLDMVRLRLRQWAAAATGPDDWRGVFTEPLDETYALADATPTWAALPAPARRRRAVARDLAASVARFNRRWGDAIGALKLDALNQQIDHYNRYYLLEKECVIGSARLAARNFAPKPRLTLDSLLADHPMLPAVEAVV